MNLWKSLKGLPHDMWVIFFTTLINRSGTMVLPFLTIYLTTVRGRSVAEAGFVIAAYGFGSVVTSPVMGKLSDRIGALKLMKGSLILSGLIIILFSFVTNYYLMLVTVFVWSVIMEAFRPANLALISEVVGTGQRRTAFALNRLAINLGMSIGPVAGGFLSMVSFSLLFYVDAVTSILAGIYLSLTKLTSVIETVKKELSSEKNISLFKDKSFLFFLIGVVPANIVFFQHIGAMPVFVVEDLGYSTASF